MKTVVFIPTARKGGLDIIEASLARQTNKDFSLIVADTLYGERRTQWHKIARNLGVDFAGSTGPHTRPGYRGNYVAAYNEAAQLSVETEADLFISLQDYIWIPPDGVDRFIRIAEKCPDDLITGLTSIAKHPDGVTVNHNSQNSDYSIFTEPYANKPEEIDWLDCRIDGVYEYHPDDIALQILPEHWEANWAAVPTNYFKHGIFWDEEYDRGIAYENMDFAKRAIAFSDRRVIMDTKNHAISLPHKDYFSGERQEILDFSNKTRYEERWGPS